MMASPPLGKGIVVKKQHAEQYEDFSPILLRQFTTEEWEVEQCTSFNDAADVFFAALETKKIEVQEGDKTKTVESKKERFLREHRKRVEELENNERKKEHVANLILQYVPEIEEVLTIVRGAIQRGMSWEELHRVIKLRQREGHAVANLIHRLALERNGVELLLSDKDIDEDEEDPSAPVEVVEIDIDLSAHANARRYFDLKKQHHSKLEKTLAAENKAAASTEKKSKRVGEKIHVKKEPQQARPTFWFEKFQWFLTQEGFIVVAGRDAQQNDLLVRRYLRRGDLFVHVDVPDSPVGIVKNPDCRPVPMSTVQEAGCMIVCRSSAWESRTVISAWWVHYHQVTRPCDAAGASTVVPFTIKGKKNYLSPKPLAMGIVMIFCLDKDSASITQRQAAAAAAAAVASQTSSHDGDAEYIPPTDPAMDDLGGMTRQTTDEDMSDTLAHPVQTTAGPSSSEGTEGAQQRQTSGAARHPAKARRMLRKEVSDDSSEVTSVSQSGGAKSQQSSEPGRCAGASIPAKQQQLQQQQQPQGARRSKVKKIQKKYADQDEEDRELAMQLLGNPLSKFQQQQKEQQRTGCTKKGKPSCDDLADFEDEAKEPPVTENSNNEDGTKQQGDEETQSQRRPREVKFADEALPKREKSEVVDDATLVEKMNAEIAQAQFFVGNPQDTDNILFAIPMCAPWSCVHKYKYAMKLTPGVERKGKSAKMAQTAFTSFAQATPSEKASLVRGKEDEYISIIVGSAKVHAMIVRTDAPTQHHADPASAAAAAGSRREHRTGGGGVGGGVGGNKGRDNSGAHSVLTN